MTTNRPPSCDLPPDHYQPKLKPCPICGAEAERSSCNKSVTRCSDINCLTYGPWGDPHGHKWNSIPRRSEVLELLNKLEFAMLASDWNRQDELEDLQRCATKLRKEMGE